MRITFRRVAATAFVLVVLVLGWTIYALFTPARPIVVSKQTTYLTEPLGADGLPDYGLALLQRQREGVTPENNGAIPFWQAMWPGGLTRRERYLLLRELEMSEPNIGLRDSFNDKEIRHELMCLLLKYHGHERLAEAYRARPLEQHNPYDFVGIDGEREIERYTQEVNHLLGEIRQPWTAAQIPPLAEWLEDNERSFDLLLQAATRPKFYSPSPSLIDGEDHALIGVLLPAVDTMRLAIRSLCMRALFRISSHEYEEAWRDLQAGYRLADLTAHKRFLVTEIASLVSNGIVDEAALHLLDRQDLPSELARDIFSEYQRRRPRRAMADIISERERLVYLEMAVRISKGKPGIEGIPATLQAVSVDWNLILEEGNEWFDRIETAGNIENWEERQAALAEIRSEFEAQHPSATRIAISLFSRTSRSLRFSEVFASLMFPATSVAFTVEDRSNTQLELMRLAAALAVYRTENGDYPGTLDALVPEVLEKLPLDLFHQKPFVYQKTENSYLLYSMGTNGQDDGGSGHRLNCYQGYEINEEDALAVMQVLGENPPPNEKAQNLNGAQSDDAPLFDSYDEFHALKSRIPKEADDQAIRMPRPKYSLPVLRK